MANRRLCVLGGAQRPPQCALAAAWLPARQRLRRGAQLGSVEFGRQLLARLLAASAATACVIEECASVREENQQLSNFIEDKD